MRKLNTFITNGLNPEQIQISLVQSAVGIATGYRLDDRGVGVRIQGSAKNVHFGISFRPALVPTQYPNQWVPGIKRQEREADDSPPTSAEVRKMAIYASTPPHVCMA
jgi:hypothetical protein